MSQIDEFSNTLQALLDTKPPGVSGSKIKKIVHLAIANVQSESVLIQKLFTHFKKTPPSHKLGALYVVDAVVRAYQDEAKKAEQPINGDAKEGTFASGVSRVQLLIDGVMADAFAANPPPDQIEKIKKVLDIWERAETFPLDLINSIREKYVSASVPSGGSTTPPGPPPAHLMAPGGIAASVSSTSNNSTGAISGTTNTANVDNNAGPQDTASILQALANIAKQKSEGATGSIAPVTAASAVSSSSSTGIESIPAPPASLPAPPGQSAPTPEQFQLMQKLMSQAPPPSTAAVTGQPWGLSRNSDHRSRSRSPTSGGARNYGTRDYNNHNNNNNNNSYDNNYRSRSPIQGTIDDLRPTPVYNVSYDNTLPPGTIRVFSRTLFIGGVPPNMNQRELTEALRPYGQVQSMVFHKEKKHAFVKMFTRKDAEFSREKFEELNRNGSHGLRARWGVGFGPRDCCDYQSGVSIVPINRLTDADKRWVVHAEYGGTGGKPLEQGLVIEEPDIEIGSGVSSKAISRRMPTNSSRYGPRSTVDGDEERRGREGSGDRDRFRDRNRDRYAQPQAQQQLPLQQQQPQQQSQGMPPELAALLSKMSSQGNAGTTQQQPQQQQQGFQSYIPSQMPPSQMYGQGQFQQQQQQPTMPGTANGQFSYPYAQYGNFMQSQQQQPPPQ